MNRIVYAAILLALILLFGGITYCGFRNDFERRDRAGMRNYGTNGGALP